MGAWPTPSSRIPAWRRSTTHSTLTAAIWTSTSELVDELGARSVLDIGCGTGTFACPLAQRGIDVTAVDPAGASLDVARAKPGAAAVRWLQGDATTLPPLRVDAAFMTANVAQVFLTDDDWVATLRGIRDALRPGGRPRVRDPRPGPPCLGAMDAGAHPNDRGRARHRRRGVLGGGHRGRRATCVTFRSMTAFQRDDVVIESVSTLRFRDRPQVEVVIG